MRLGRTAVAASTAPASDMLTQARYARERYELYRAKVYGPRQTSMARLRELQRACELAESRLRWARIESIGRDARAAGAPSPAAAD